MVNLVVRGSSNNLMQRSRDPSPAVTRIPASPKTAPHRSSIPSPIQVPSYRRPLSPLTAVESMFGESQQRQLQQSQMSKPLQPQKSHMATPRDPAATGPHTSSNMSDPILRHTHSSDASSNGRHRITMSSSGSSQGEVLVCDYDLNVTALYELLESSQWDKARLRCRTHPEEVQTWIVRQDASTHEVRWKLLPIHAAVIFQAPACVLEDLLKEYPVGAGKKDDQGMLPLHLAFRHKQNNQDGDVVLELLLERYPSAVSVVDRRDRLPIDHGKESDYSAALLKMYAQAHTKCVPNANLVKESMEAQMEQLKTMYEEQMEALAQEHKRELQQLTHKNGKEQERARSQHDQEMDELRDLLSREVAAGQRAVGLEHEVQDLERSLSKANQETQVLRSVLHEHSEQQSVLQSQLKTVLGDQQRLQSACAQQQQDYEETQSARDNLLKQLLTLDSNTAHVSRSQKDMLQLSESIRRRTEKLLQAASGNEPKKSTTTNPTTPTSRKKTTVPNTASSSKPEERRRLIKDYATPSHRRTEKKLSSAPSPDEGKSEGNRWDQNPDDHGDDISAITENSHF